MKGQSLSSLLLLSNRAKTGMPVALVLIIVILLSNFSFERFGQPVQASQPPSTNWTQNYGSYYSDEEVRSVIQTSDGGYAFAGTIYSYPNPPTGYHGLLVKTDASGSMQWNMTYGGNGENHMYSVIQTSDGGYALAGYTNSYSSGDFDFWLVKTDSSGNQLWSKTYGLYGVQDYAYSMVKTNDGGFAIAGQGGVNGSSSTYAMLVKTDSSGILAWPIKYFGAVGSVAYSITKTSDGGYALAGSALFKVDSSGSLQIEAGSLRLPQALHAYSIIQCSDGSYVYAGDASSTSVGTDIYLIKMEQGWKNILWTQIYGGSNYDSCYSLVQTADGGFAFGGGTKSFGHGNWDFYLVKTNSAGTLDWQNYYGGAYEDQAYSMAKTVDGGLALAGYSKSYTNGGSDMWLIKLSELAPSPTPTSSPTPTPSPNAAGNYIVAEALADKVSMITPGGVRTEIYSFIHDTSPVGVTVDSSGNYIVAEYSSNKLSMVYPSGVETVVYNFASGTGPEGVAVDGSGNYIVTEYLTGKLSRITPGGARTVIYNFPQDTYPKGVAIDGSGNYIVAEWSNNAEKLVMITPGGARTVIYTFAPNTGCNAVAIDGSGNYIITEYIYETLSMINPGGARTVIYNFPSGTYPQAVAIDSMGSYIVTEHVPATGVDKLSKITPTGAGTEIYTFAPNMEPDGVAIVPGYSATIWAWDAIDPNGWIVEPITLDGVATGFSTPHTFTGLSGSHTITVSSINVDGRPFSSWDSGETSTTFTVASGGIHTAQYALPTPTPTPIPSPTSSPTPTLTPTPTPIPTPTPTATPNPTPEPTSASTPTATPTRTSTPTLGPFPSSSSKSTKTASPSESLLPTPTQTSKPYVSTYSIVITVVIIVAIGAAIAAIAAIIIKKQRKQNTIT